MPVKGGRTVNPDNGCCWSRRRAPPRSRATSGHGGSPERASSQVKMGGDEGNRTLNPRLAKMGDPVAQGLYQQQRPRGTSLGAPRHRRPLSFRATRRATTARGEAPRFAWPEASFLAADSSRRSIDAKERVGAETLSGTPAAGTRVADVVPARRHLFASRTVMSPLSSVASTRLSTPRLATMARKFVLPCDSAALLLTQVRWEVRPGTSERSSLNVMEGGAGPQLPTSRSDGGQDRCGSGGARLGHHRLAAP